MSLPFASPAEFDQPRLYVGGANWIPVQVPEGARFLHATIHGAGGNGGAGASGASGTARGGGGGGGGGYISNVVLPTKLLPPTIFLFLANPGASSYLSIIPFNATFYYIANSGSGGTGGVGTGVGVGAGGAIGNTAGQSMGGLASARTTALGVIGAAGGALANGAGITAATNSNFPSQGGGGGGGVTTIGQNGGSSGYGVQFATFVSGGVGNNGIDGFYSISPYVVFTGGSGGGSADAAPGGNGGNGAPGCGGGGGGAGTTGGAGGLGGPGFAILIWR